MKKKLLLRLLLLLLLLFSISACDDGAEDDEPYDSTELIDEEDDMDDEDTDEDMDEDEDHSEDENSDEDEENNGSSKDINGQFKQVVVFGVHIRATNEISDAKIMHAANVMGSYLDNDEDGIADNPEVVAKLVENNALLIMHTQDQDPDILLENFPVTEGFVQDLLEHETRPEGSGPNGFDATLEEVLHILTHGGFSQIYPEALGEEAGSDIAKAMDIARGGHFKTIPAEYPASAWYSYEDDSCDYSCQITEYTYWILTSALGAQDYPARAEETEGEWALLTPAQVKATDKTAYDIIFNPTFKMPTRLPDGTYQGTALQLEK